MSIAKLIQSIPGRVVIDAFIIGAMMATEDLANSGGEAAVLQWAVSFPILVLLSWSDFIIEAIKSHR